MPRMKVMAREAEAMDVYHQSERRHILIVLSVSTNIVLTMAGGLRHLARNPYGKTIRFSCRHFAYQLCS